MVNAEAHGHAEILAAIGATEKEIPKILAASLNRTAAGLRTYGSRLVGKDYNVKQKDVRRRIEIKKASPVFLFVRLEGSGSSAIPLVQFRVGSRRVPSTHWRGLKGSKKPAPSIGSMAMVTRGRKYKVVGAFVAKMKSGHIGMFVRSGRTKYIRRGGYAGREIINHLSGPAPVELLSYQQYKGHMDLKAQELMDKEVKNSAEFLLSKYRK